MSSEERLKRLGLWDLRDDPQALQIEIAKRLKQAEKVEAESDVEHLEELEKFLKDKPDS